MKAVVMAGGEGTRLRPLTCDRPKPMVPLANMPVMYYAVELLREAGWPDIAVTLQYLPRKIMDFFGSGEDYGVRLHYFLESTPLGTAGSVRNAVSFLDETFVVVSGDALTDFHLEEAADFHRRRGAMATLVLTSVDNPLEYGVVITDGEGRIQRFLEKPGWGEVFSDRVNTGIYLLEPEVLDLIPEGKPFDFSKDLFPLMLRRKMPLYGCLLKGFWCDIGNIAEYRRAHMELLAGRVAVNYPGEERSEGIRVGRNTAIDPRASLRGPILIGDNCLLEAGVTVDPFTVIGNNVIVEEGASLKQAIIWDGTTVGRRSAVRRAVLGRGVSLETNTAVYEGAAVGDGCSIRSFSVIKPEVKIWPDKEVDQYTTVKENMIWGSKCSRSLFSAMGVGGFLHRELTPSVVSNAAGAFGSLWAPGSKVVVSRASGAGPALLQTAAMAGLLGCGINVVDAGETFLPVNRWAVRSLGLAGGIHIRRDTREEGWFWLVFLDARGLSLATNQRRKMDTAYQLGETRRVKEEDLVLVERISDLGDRYLAYLNGAVGSANLPVKRTPFLVHSPSSQIIATLGRLSSCLPWELGLADGLENLPQEIVDRGAAGGASIDSEGERLHLWDASGKPLPQQTVNVLLAQVALGQPRPAVLALPVTMSSRAAAMAQAAGVEVKWVKDDWRAIAEATWEAPLGGRQVQMLGDALFALSALIMHLSSRDLDLTQAHALLPETWQKIKDARCPWSVKGKVLRQLAESEKSVGVEQVDGLKVFHENGWALVLPDADEPFYHVYSEACSPDMAEALCQQYVEKIGGLVREMPQLDPL